jgi:hypothetical protein
MKVKQWTLTDLLNRIIAQDTSEREIIAMARNIHDQIWNQELIIVDVAEAIDDEIKTERDVYSYFDMYVQILLDAYKEERE